MGMCRALQGRLTEAIEIGERAVSMSGRAPFYLGVLGHYYARSGAPSTRCVSSSRSSSVLRISGTSRLIASRTSMPG